MNLIQFYKKIDCSSVIKGQFFGTQKTYEGIFPVVWKMDFQFFVGKITKDGNIPARCFSAIQK